MKRKRQKHHNALWSKINAAYLGHLQYARQNNGGNGAGSGIPVDAPPTMYYKSILLNYYSRNSSIVERKARNG